MNTFEAGRGEAGRPNELGAHGGLQPRNGDNPSTVAVERTCMGFLLRRAEPADPTPIPNPERSVLDRHPSTTIGAPTHDWSEARLPFGLTKRTVESERKTERDM